MVAIAAPDLVPQESGSTRMDPRKRIALRLSLGRKQELSTFSHDRPNQSADALTGRHYFLSESMARHRHQSITCHANSYIEEAGLVY